MARVYFITHPEVTFDRTLPVPMWDLSAVGVRRLAGLVRQEWVKTLRGIFASTERKAVTTGRYLAEAIGAELRLVAGLGEIARSATGVLPPEEYSAVTDAFFARPEESARGWERAVDAQRRIVRTLETILKEAQAHPDIAVVSHGGVGTLLLCHLKGVPIRRAEDQPGQGHYFMFDSGGKLMHGWQRIDEDTP